MKPIIRILSILAAVAGMSSAQTGSNFTNFIVQKQNGTTRYLQSIAAKSVGGGVASPDAIEFGGSHFELWTVLNAPLTNYHLDTRYVGAVPVVDIVIRSEDPYSTPPRTRADRPFWVDIKVDGLLNGPSDPPATKAVDLLRHVQSYGPSGTGEGLDRTQAQLLSNVRITKALLNADGTRTLDYSLTSVPGPDRAKVRGEERFSVFSLLDERGTVPVPPAQLASKYVQIWPVADGKIAGLEKYDVSGPTAEVIRFALPALTLTVKDIYPESQVYAQVYKGPKRDNVEGTVVPGSAKAFSESVPPPNVLLTVQDWDAVFEGEDGEWTMELLNATPFDILRLDHVTFHVNRTIHFNGSVTTIE